MFQSLPFPQVSNSLLSRQTTSTNICKRMHLSPELIEFQHGSIIGCNLCSKVQQLHFFSTKYSTVNCWWYYKKVEETGNINSVCRASQLSGESMAVDIQFSCAFQISLENLMQRFSTVMQLLQGLTSTSSMQLCKVNFHWTKD